MTATVTLANQKSFKAPPGVSLLDAAAAAGLALPHSCRSGRCSSCKTRVLRGQVLPLRTDTVLSAEERAAGWSLSCIDAAAPDCELQLDLEDQAELAGLRSLTLPARVERLERRADLLILSLRLPLQPRLAYLPGQYLDLIAPGGLRRSYSIANAPRADGRIELHIRRVAGGAMSEFLFDQLQPEQLLHLQGPRGSFHLRQVEGRPLLLLATGTGIAPIKAMLEGMTQRPSRTLLIWGNRRSDDIYWQPPAGVEFWPVCSREAGAARTGHLQQHLPDGDLSAWTVRACGNPAMLDAARALLLARGLPEREFHADAFVASGQDKGEEA
ncbi:CDP-4-dehydro-6-deoxyglucose reductase [Inhella inkyongensis]|uniref:CDP-4-dehydro-6-deoxyglucose reductase n=1 Tax=Inhella inkyongensis TaxID=392593 RepID=A0A840SA24_9BURK|nr:FAD-binding oxidoreductase [Inhella inkyongensis]MBB5206378.1 CDP-4-dehydro-6-deoxyglucose reductase [Inhella inkyongensis]